jgi:valyl-tRNA synthetase
MSTADTADLAKTYDPAAVEAEAYRVWTDENCFAGDPTKPGEPYSIVIPPPNVTGALHLGHAINNTLQDILVRQHRMAGFNTVWIPGIDHAGIATQAVVEKQLKEKENKTRHDVGREGLVERIWAWKQQYGDRILMQLQRLGCSCDWGRTRFTLDEMCARAVRETFFKLFKDGLVYRGKRLVNWDIALQTSISDDEIYHESVKTNLWHIRYAIVNREAPDVHPGLRPTHMTVATTRPETLLGDTAVAVHSGDARWNWAIGLTVELPLIGRLIPIIADDILVDPAFGSGVVKVTPAHDPNDYAVYQRHLGQPDAIDIINLMNPDGTLNAAAGKYAGLTMAAARKAVVADLGDALVKEEPYETQVGHSDRSKTPIQPYLSDQWFVKMAPLAEPALDVVRDGTIKFFPERHAQQYLSWLGEKRDWPISRQLWWGHRIPVWYIEKNQPGPVLTVLFACGLNEKFHWPEGTMAPVICTQDEETDRVFEILSDVVNGRITKESAAERLPVTVGRDAKPLIDLACAFITRLDRDPDVLDTWFSSALWPHSTLGWPARTADLAKWYPTSVLMTGRDIITLWVARMVMMGMYNMGRGTGVPPVRPEHGRDAHATGIPFAHVAINPTILDGNGERMSKQKGNGVDPVDVIDSHGADALRFTLTTMATETQDARLPILLVCPHCRASFPNPSSAAGTGTCPKCKKPYTRALGTAVGMPEAPLAKPTSDRFDAGRNFCNKLWNAARFALANLAGLPASADSAPTDESAWSLADRWIVSRFSRTLAAADAALAIYRFDQYAAACYDFFWRDFCDWYVEASKPAMKDPARQTQTAHVLAAVLDGVLRLMHPMIPFITETIWWKLNEVRPTRGLPGRLECPPSARLIHAQWPKASDTDDAAEQQFAQLQEIIGAVRTLRNEHKADAKKPVTVSTSAGPEPKRLIDANREMIEQLAICTLAQVGPDLTPPPHSARASVAGCDIYVEGLIDPAAEGQRVAKLIEQKQKQAAALRGRLANPSYADKAPPHLVQQTRDELAAVEAELAKLTGG